MQVLSTKSAWTFSVFGPLMFYFKVEFKKIHNKYALRCVKFETEFTKILYNLKTLLCQIFVHPKIDFLSTYNPFKFESLYISGQYQQNLCPVGDLSCAACPSRLPSCVGAQNGYKEFPTRLWKSDFVKCFLNRTTEINKCPPNEYFNPRLKQCMEKVLPGEYWSNFNIHHINRSFSHLSVYRFFFK